MTIAKDEFGQVTSLAVGQLWVNPDEEFPEVVTVTEIQAVQFGRTVTFEGVNSKGGAEQHAFAQEYMPVPVVGDTWLHMAKETKYVIRGVTNLKSTDLEKFPVTVVYSPADDFSVVWSRDLKIFLDRFTFFDAATKQAPLTNTISYAAYDAEGKRTVSGARTSFDPAFDLNLMTGFLELEQACRLRGVPIDKHKLGALWVTSNEPNPESTDNGN